MEFIDGHRLASRFSPLLHFHPDEGQFCCFPSDAEETYAKFHSNWKLFVEDRTPKELVKSTPCYYEFWDEGNFFQIRYWFWYRHNDFPGAPLNLGNHLGDWENIEVRLYESMDLSQAIWIFSNHYEARLASMVKTLEGFEREIPILDESHINAWVALGTHANYPTPKSKPRCYARIFCDKISEGGEVWATGTNLKHLEKTNFATFKGRWGDKKAPRGPANEYNNRWRNAPNLRPI
ncbi:MAG: hypothetical protein ACFFE3_09410 [Candidatus Thorarchaeota archaeon]